MLLRTEPITAHSPFRAQVDLLAKEAFPPEEYLAPAKLIDMARSDHFDFLALLDGDDFVGFLAVLTYENMAYLFFLAIDASRRGEGYGSRALETLRAQYPGMTHVVDFEMPDPAAANREQRLRRRRFYQRSGYQETGLFLSYLGVDYEVFCAAGTFDPARFKALMKTVPLPNFSPRYFTR